MRRLRNTRTGSFRRRAEDERGAVAVIVAVLMVALLGCAAIAVDVGLVYAERAQLQNGADAAALAVAADCAAGDCSNAEATAQHFANSNANDGVSTVLPPVIGSNSVTVWTEARAPGSGTDGLPLFFARIFGMESTEVGAQATATWTAASGAVTALPLTFAACEFNRSGSVQLLTYHGTANCSSTSPNGENLPGGFGWLDSADGECGVYVDPADPFVSSDPGVSLSKICKENLDSLKNTTVWLPVYEESGGQGTNGWYRVQGWAAFHLTGWRFPSKSWNNAGICTGNCKGVIGTFIDYVDLEEGVPGLGAPTVSLTE